MVISLLINSIEGLLARPMMANLARLPLPTSTCWSQIQARGCTGSLQCNAMQDAILCNAMQDVILCNVVQDAILCNVMQDAAIWRSITIHGLLAVCNAMQCDEAWDTFQKYDYNADALFAMCTGLKVVSTRAWFLGSRRHLYPEISIYTTALFWTLSWQLTPSSIIWTW